MKTFFQRELLTDTLIRNLMALNLGHHREVSAHQDLLLRPDYGAYLAAQAAGQLRVYTVRDADTYRLQGYAVHFVRMHPHFSTSLQAAQDVLYLAPEARQGWTGYHFIQWCDAQLQREGVEIVYQHVTPARDFGPLLERLGYEAVDLTYARRLDHGSSGTHPRGRVRRSQHHSHGQREQQRPTGQPATAATTGHAPGAAEAGPQGATGGGAHSRGPDGTERSGVSSTGGVVSECGTCGHGRWEGWDVADRPPRIGLIYAARGMII